MKVIKVCNYIEGETPIGDVNVLDKDGLKSRNIGRWIRRYLTAAPDDTDVIVKLDPDCLITGPLVIPDGQWDVAGHLTGFKNGLWPLGGAFLIKREAAIRIANLIWHPDSRYLCNYYIDSRGKRMPIEEDALSHFGRLLDLKFREWPGSLIRFRPYIDKSEISDKHFIYHPYKEEL